MQRLVLCDGGEVIVWRRWRGREGGGVRVLREERQDVIEHAKEGGRGEREREGGREVGKRERKESTALYFITVK